MIRKLVQHGPTTLITSLPVNWIKRYGLKRGDEVEITEQGTVLEISTKKSIAKKSAKISISQLDTSLIWRMILSLYRFGVDEIHVTHHDQTDLIYKIANDRIGLGIVEQGKNTLVIKDLSGASKGEFDNIYRRCHLLLLSLVEKFIELTEQKKDLDEIPVLDKNLNRYIDYCLRLLSKHGYKEPQKTNLYYIIISQLEYVSDKLAILARNNFKKSNELKEIYQLLRRSYELSFKYTDETATNIIQFKRRFEKKDVNKDLKEIASIVLNLVDAQFAISLRF